ncbi:hypothetical protein D3C81_1105920 [compost metagenome]
MRQGELDRDGVDLGHAEQALGIAGAHQVAGVDVADANAPGDGGANLRVGELDFGIGDGGLVAFYGGLQLIDQRLLLVEGLLGHAVIAAEQAVALEVDAGHLDLSLALAELGAGLVEAGADAAVVQGGQQVALLDPLALFDEHPGQHPFDLRFYFDAVQRQHGADGAGVARHVLLGNADHAHRNGALGARNRRLLALAIPDAQCCEGEQGGGGQQERAGRTSHWRGHLGQEEGAVIEAYSAVTGSAA